MNKFSQFAKKSDIRLEGEKVSINDVFDKNIALLACRIMQSRAVKNKEVLQLQFSYVGDDSRYILFTNSEVLRRQMKEYEENLPFEAKIIRTGSCYTLAQEDE